MAKRRLSVEPSVKYCLASCVFRKTPSFFCSISKATSAFSSAFQWRARRSAFGWPFFGSPTLPDGVEQVQLDSREQGTAFLKSSEAVYQILKRSQTHDTV